MFSAWFCTPITPEACLDKTGPTLIPGVTPIVMPGLRPGVIPDISGLFIADCAFIPGLGILRLMLGGGSIFGGGTWRFGGGIDILGGGSCIFGGGMDMLVGGNDKFCGGGRDIFCSGATDIFCGGATDIFCGGGTDMSADSGTLMLGGGTARFGTCMGLTVATGDARVGGGLVVTANIFGMSESLRVMSSSPSRIALSSNSLPLGNVHFNQHKMKNKYYTLKMLFIMTLSSRL